MFGLTKTRSLILGASGVVLVGGLIALTTQAKAQRQVIAQAPPAAAPDAFAAPSQIGIPAAPPAIAPQTPARPERRTRRIPIDPVPMPGDVRAPLPELTRPPDIRTIPGGGTAPISGIVGKVSLTPVCSVTAPAASCRVRPYLGSIKISTVARDRVVRLATDPDGFFQIRLIPGMYVVEPDAPNFQPGTAQTITVINNVIRQMEFNFQGTLPPGTAAVTLPPLPGTEPAAR